MSNTTNMNFLFDIPDIKKAILEANRCLQCKKPGCREGCPIHNDIPEFIAAVAAGNFGEASRIIDRKSNLPAVCGRVCAHEIQCEGHCVLAGKKQAIQIGMIEKTVADFKFELELPFFNVLQKTRGRVAIIGSGPAGLTVAGDLAKAGFEVFVFEAQSEPGGVLLYGIPSFRLSKKIVRREIKNIEAVGVKFHTHCVIGQKITVDSLFADGFDAVFIGSGTAIAKELDVPGKDLDGVIQSSYLLRTSYLHRSGQLSRDEVMVNEGETIVIIGAGNVGMDAARSALRLGAGMVTVVHRGGKETRSALQSEYEAAKEEGVKFLWNTIIHAFDGKNGKVVGLTCLIDNKVERIVADKAFLAIGSKPANRIVSTTTGIEVDNDGYVIIKELPYGMTTRKGVFAGGDVVHRPASVVMAMGEAKKVAEGIALYVSAVKLLEL